MKRLVGVSTDVRFNSHVDKNGPFPSAIAVKCHPEIGGSRCWVWINVLPNRHPVFRLNGKYVRSSRVAFEMHTKRAIASGMCICHKCDNPICVNPIHLFEGTHIDNMRDRGAKGRSSGGNTGPKIPLSGENHRSAQITLDDAKYILANHSFEKRNGRELAAKFGVRPQIIYRIVHGRTWRRELAGVKGRNVDDAAIAQARADYVKGSSIHQLAVQYGMSESAMHGALVGKTWKHVPGAITEMRPFGYSPRLNRKALVAARITQ